MHASSTKAAKLSMSLLLDILANSFAVVSLVAEHLLGIAVDVVHQGRIGGGALPGALFLVGDDAQALFVARQACLIWTGTGQHKARYGNRRWRWGRGQDRPGFARKGRQTQRLAVAIGVATPTGRPCLEGRPCPDR
jgi:hypothetical protein